MKISERTVKRLGEIITGDKGISPYRGGPKLVSFFNECGTNHTYGQGFPSRWMFAEDCIRQFNDTPTMKKVILSAVDPRDFMGTTVYDKETKQEKPANLLDCQPVVRSVDTLHLCVRAFPDAGFLRCSRIAQHIAHLIALGPCAVRAGEGLARH